MKEPHARDYLNKILFADAELLRQDGQLPL
jgi:hypothetical protein